MLVFDQDAADASVCAPALPAPDRAPCEVNVCPVCRSPLVHPLDWHRRGPSLWRITLRCPNCETVRTLMLDRQAVERLNRALYEGTEKLARQADQLTRRHFQEESDKFVAALDAGLILPIDF